MLSSEHFVKITDGVKDLYDAQQVGEAWTIKAPPEVQGSLSTQNTGIHAVSVYCQPLSQCQ